MSYPEHVARLMEASIPLAKEVNPVTIREQAEEIRRLEATIANIPHLLAILIDQQDYIIETIPVPYVECPQCAYEVPRRTILLERRFWTCPVCIVAWPLATNTVTRRKAQTLADFAFDLGALSGKRQAALLAPYLTGEKQIEFRCAQCGKEKHNGDCEEE